MLESVEPSQGRVRYLAGAICDGVVLEFGKAVGQAGRQSYSEAQRGQYIDSY